MALVLSRKIGQKLLLGKDIIVSVNRVAGNRVTLGIEAPEEVKIIRAELPNSEAIASELRPIRICGDGTTPPELPAGSETGTGAASLPSSRGEG